MTRLFAGLIVSSGALFAQNVTVVPGDWEAKGIEITPYSSPSFAGKAAAKVVVAVDTTSLHPVSFFLTNHTGHTIVAYSTVWTVKNANGIVSTQSRVAGSLRSRSRGLSIPNGTERLITPVTQASGASAANPKFAARLQSVIDRTRSSFPSNSVITVSLEAVVLDDGLALGPDSTQAIQLLRAEGDGLTQLASDVLGAFNQGGQQAVVDLLSGIVSGPYPSSLAAAKMSSADDAYAAFVAHTRYERARAWLSMAKGNTPLLADLANQQANETSLAVHR